MTPEKTYRAVTLPMNRKQRRRAASEAVRSMKADLVLAGKDPRKVRKQLAKWDGVDMREAPSLDQSAFPPPVAAEPEHGGPKQ